MREQEHFLQVAKAFAEGMGHTYIGTEHLMLAIISERFPQHTNRFRQEVINLIGEGKPYELSLRNQTNALKRALRDCYTCEDFITKMCDDNCHDSAGVIIHKSDLIISDFFPNKKNGETEETEEKEQALKSRLISFYRDKDKSFPTLSTYARNLNSEYIKGNIPQVFGRNKEIEMIKRIMLRRNKTNVLLTGKAGCGKTAIVEGLAIDIVNLKKSGNDSHFSDFVIYDLDLNNLVSGAKYRGDFEERTKKVLDEVANRDDVIIFIDEIHQINGIGLSSDNGMGLGQALKPALSRNLIKCIGATTTDESHYIKKDKALARRFSEITVSEFSKEKQKEISKSILKDYGKFHEIGFEKVDIEKTMEFVHNLMVNTIFPDNIINIIDESMANAKYDEKTEIDMDDIKKTVSRITGYLIV